MKELSSTLLLSGSWEHAKFFLYLLSILFLSHFLNCHSTFGEVSMMSQHAYALGFQVLMAAISLRRTKENGLVGLPSKSIETFFVNLREEERRIYDQMEEEARKIVKGYMSDESVVRNYSTVLSILVRLRQICTDLALCPADLRALLPPSQIEGNQSDLTALWISMLSTTCQ